MARKQRYHIPGAFYHVMLRGNDGQTIVFCDSDRSRMCLLIQEGVEKYGHRIHAFCFMGNHIHLLVQVGNIPLSKLIHNLSFRYSQFINRRHKKIGHLFQGRFKAIIIQENTYFLRLLRYIHMNPIRAHLVKEPETYLWSSHRAYLGNVEFVWLTTNYGLSKFENNLDVARLEFRNYVLKQETEESLKELQQGFKDGQILGDDNFLENIKNSRNDESSIKISVQIILESLYQIYSVDQTTLASRLRTDRLSVIRGAAGLFARQKGIPLEELAKAFKRDGSTISRLAQQFSQKQAYNEDLQNQYQQLEMLVTRFAVTHA